MYSVSGISLSFHPIVLTAIQAERGCVQVLKSSKFDFAPREVNANAYITRGEIHTNEQNHYCGLELRSFIRTGELESLSSSLMDGPSILTSGIARCFFLESTDIALLLMIVAATEGRVSRGKDMTAIGSQMTCRRSSMPLD